MDVQVKLVPTEEQVEVIKAVAGKDSVMVDAYAGCAKSSTLEMAAPGVRVPALGVAFNKKIATDLSARMPSNFTVKTFNGLGFAASIRALQGAPRAQLDDKKLGKIVSQVAKDRDIDLTVEQWDDLRRLVVAAMQAGVTPGDRGRPLVENTKQTWADLADEKWIMPEQFEFLYEMAQEVLVRDIEMVEKQGIFSFDDQVYISACIAGNFPQYPVVFVDEKQDLSPLNLAQLALCVREDGRLAAVGDDRQSIYAFRGADAKASRKIRLIRENWVDRTLATTFRCPKVIVERQQGHVPGYRAWHTNAEGRVVQLEPGNTEFDLDEGWNWGTVEGLKPHPAARVMVLCRNNGPLLSLAFKLIRAQVGVVMLGRDIGKGLITLSRKILPEDSISRDICAGLIQDWMSSESSLARANGHEEKVAGITDRGECLLAVVDSGCRDAGELRGMLQKLFSREAGQVELSSIHRAKGLEKDVIVHLDPWRIPSKYAKDAAKAGDGRQLEQEFNLLYVAETRTKHTLINCNLEDFSG